MEKFVKFNVWMKSCRMSQNNSYNSFSYSFASGPVGSTDLLNYNTFGLAKLSDSEYAIFVKFADKQFVFRLIKTSRGIPTVLCYPTDFDEELWEILLPELKKFVTSIGMRKITDTKPRDFDNSLAKLISIEPIKKVKHLTEATIKAMCSDFGIDVSEEVSSNPFVYTGCTRDYMLLRQQDAEAEAIFETDRLLVGSKTLREDLIETAEEIKRGMYNAITFSGPTGTGKTMDAILMSQYLGAPLLRYCGDSGTTKEDLFGTWSEDPEYDGVTHLTKYKLNYGPALKAIVYGYMLLIDEYNFILPDVQSPFNQVIDGTAAFFSYAGMSFKIHPNFVLMCTCNPGYKGTTESNDSFKNRHKNIAVPALTKSEFVARIKTYKRYSPDYPNKFFELLYDYQAFVQGLADSLMESATVCIRHAFKFLDSLSVGMYNEDTQQFGPMDLEHFTKAYIICYIYATCHWDGDTTASIQAFVNTPEFKGKMADLYSHYPYQVSEESSEEFCDFTAWKTDKDAGFVTSEPAVATTQDSDSLDSIFSNWEEIQI